MKPDQFLLDRLSKDPSNWRGPFYGCKKDPRLFVPKPDSSLGWMDSKLPESLYLAGNHRNYFIDRWIRLPVILEFPENLQLFSITLETYKRVIRISSYWSTIL